LEGETEAYFKSLAIFFFFFDEREWKENQTQKVWEKKKQSTKIFFLTKSGSFGKKKLSSG
jgi:hypothetical protein